MPQQNGNGQRLIEQRQHWLFKGFDLGHLLTMGLVIIGAVIAVQDLKTDIAVIKSQIERQWGDFRELKNDFRELQQQRRHSFDAGRP